MFRQFLAKLLGASPTINVNINTEAFMSALTDALSQINAAADAAVARINAANNTNTAQSAQIADLTSQVSTLKTEADAAAAALTEKAKALTDASNNTPPAA